MFIFHNLELSRVEILSDCAFASDSSDFSSAATSQKLHHFKYNTIFCHLQNFQGH